LSAGDANSTFGRTTSLLLGLLTRPALAHAIMAKPTAAAANAKRRCFRMEASQYSSVTLLRHPANVCDGHHEMSLFAQPHAFWQRLSKPAPMTSRLPSGSSENLTPSPIAFLSRAVGFFGELAFGVARPPRGLRRDHPPYPKRHRFTNNRFEGQAIAIALNSRDGRETRCPWQRRFAGLLAMANFFAGWAASMKRRRPRSSGSRKSEADA
jgi:hypothetical protein